MKFPRLMAALLLLALLGHSEWGWAATPEDAKTLVLQAADEIAKVGPAKAYPEFLDRAGPFWKGETYVFVLSFEGVWLVYPPKPEAAGTLLIGLTDVDGKAFIREMIDMAKSKGEGWVEYKWKNPETGMMQIKESFVKRVGDVIITAGVFK